MTRHLTVLTNSSITTFRRCPREYQYRYVYLIKPTRVAPALQFGKLFHIGLNAWWAATSPHFNKWARALEAMHAVEGVDPFDMAKAHALMAGYTTRWGDEPYETVAVEKRFALPVYTAISRAPSFELRGSIDAVVRQGRVNDHLNGEATLYNVEHKTTSSDISPGSGYWRHVIALDSQVSTYNSAAKEMGYDIRATVYDVIRKPELHPMKATPEESKKYTKPTKSEPVPRLYSGQRESDETPDEYRDRLMADIGSRPNWYFQRNEIVRLEHDDEEHAKDVAHTAEMIRYSEDRDTWPRSPNACQRFGRFCEFHPVCSGETTIDDGVRYERKTSQHEELE